jgi:hemerythrin-like domain-containing protein
MFRDQHDELLKIASDISSYLDVDRLSENAGEVSRLLSQLLGKLSVHLSMEDKALYPKLSEHPDGRVRSMARSFIAEMGGIGEAVNEYKNKWSSSLEIQKNPRDFIEQTKGIFAALAQRIERENNELYRAVDEL